jgi:formylglycine-generating enzyme required for sulfatase activity
MAETLSYHDLTLIRVPGTATLQDFYIASTPVTHSLWTHVMGSSPAPKAERKHPATRISWKDVTGSDGFLERINALDIAPGRRFRLPSEAEWEYAARGGPHSGDGFLFSGSDDIDEVAWYCARFGLWRRLVVRLLSRPPGKNSTRVHDVALKKPNQLGLYDMTGNVWEWCQDDAGNGERRLRGGCHHNWDIHCTNTFRYSQSADARGPALGFRLVLA